MKKLRLYSLLTTAVLIGLLVGGVFQNHISEATYLMRGRLLKTGQTTSYVDYDDGYYEKGIAKSYTVLTIGNFAGATNVILTHMAGSSNVSFTAGSNTITLNNGTGAMNAFLAAGNDIIVVSGATNNNGVYTTLSASVNSIVIKGTLNSNEPQGATVTIAKQEAHSNACVLDNNTGLMWSQAVSGKVGSASDGKLPWTTQANGYGIFPYAVAANTALLGGYGDWRIANIDEMFSILNFANNYFVPDTTAFPISPSSYCWTSTTLKDDTNYAILYGWSRPIDSGLKTSNFFLFFLVRGG